MFENKNDFCIFRQQGDVEDVGVRRSCSCWDCQASSTSTSRAQGRQVFNDRDSKPVVGNIDYIRTFNWEKKLETPTVINPDEVDWCHGQILLCCSRVREVNRCSIQIYNKCSNCSFSLVFRSKVNFWPKCNFFKFKNIKIQETPCQFFFGQKWSFSNW